MDSLNELEQLINQAMQRERFRFRSQIRRMREAQKAGQPFDKNLEKLTAQVRQSVELRERRLAGLPKPTYPEELPVTQRREEILAAIRDHQVVVISGETGSGKSTQIPKFCLELGRGVNGLIGHTQPRRIAARSVATRIAEELGGAVGQQVGFKIRFTDATNPQTYLKLMTDGILLAETQSDKFLDQYDTIIIDEAHERSLNIDFLLGYIKRLLPKRRDLKLIITSATIDAQRFAEHFADVAGVVPALEVSGRTYPVEVRYRPLGEDEDGSERDQQRAVCEAVSELAREDVSGPRDMLVFLPTERDIRELAKVLRGWPIPGDGPGRQTEILPLYGRLSNADQQRVFQPHPHRRIVLATNVAESSLTVPNIRSVIDTGTARISRFSATSGVQRLPVEAISQASADQRKGRCGRIGPGICIRLYSEADYQDRDRFTAPEIQRTNLASVILQLKYLNLGAIEDFPFLDPPRPTTIRGGYKTLFEIGAIDDKEQLTEIGRQLARMPADPRIGRLILAAHTENCLREVLIIASALELQDPRDRPVEKQQAADEAHAKFQHEDSDFLSYLKIWDFYHEQEDKLSRGQLRKACQQNFLNYNRLREWGDVHRQLRDMTDEAKLPLGKRADDYNAIHRALLTGLLSNVAFRGETYEYSGTGGKKLHLWPGSGLFKKKPKWIVAAEIVQTTRQYARCVARINPDWIEPLAGHLVTKNHSEPHWSRQAGSPMTFEQVSLFGLTIVPRRTVRLGPIDPEKAGQLFIQHALVERDWEQTPEFLEYNTLLLEEIETLQAKTRRADVVPGEEVLFRFYDQRLPRDVYDTHTFNRWWKQEQRKRPDLLLMTHADILAAEGADFAASDYPDTLAVNQMKLPLEYSLSPGSDRDGLTLTVPVQVVNQLDVRQLGWLVPGLLEEKITALIKSLPKSLRRNFVPASDAAKEALKRIKFGQGELLAELSRVLTEIAREPIPVSAFDVEKLPQHLRMNVKVTDAEGKEIKAGRDVQELRKELHATAADSFALVQSEQWNRRGIVTWDFGALPAQVEVPHGNLTLKGYPALVDERESVALKLFDTALKANRETRAGLRRLFLIWGEKPLKSQVEWFPHMEKLSLYAMTMGGLKLFKQELTELLADRALYTHQQDYPRNEAEFKERMKFAKNQLSVVVQDVAVVMPPLLSGLHETRRALEDVTNPAWQTSVDDMKFQLGQLTRSAWFTATPWEWLHQFPRYFQAIRHRLEKLRASLPRDQENHRLVYPHWKQCIDKSRELAKQNQINPHLEYYRWLIEEYRVSLFAQKLGTGVPVSADRLQAQWEKALA